MKKAFMNNTFKLLAVFIWNIANSCNGFNPTDSMAKNRTSGMKYICCFDGSGCSPKANTLIEPTHEHKEGRGYSNILRLHLLAGGKLPNKKNKDDDDYMGVPGQQSLYVVGPGQLPVRENWLNTLGLNFGFGYLNPHVKKIYKRLEGKYEEGDKIYVFGFSRGAAAARTFCSRLKKYGLKTKEGKTVFPDVEFLGVFDTVSMQILQDNLGILSNLISKTWPSPERLGESNGIIGDHVKNIVHIAQLDDNRMWGGVPNFRVTLVDNSEKQHEVWFPGSHSDCGGNNYRKDLVDTAFEHMLTFIEDSIAFLPASDIPDEAFGDDYEIVAQKGIDEFTKDNKIEKGSIEPKAFDEVRKWLEIKPGFKDIFLDSARKTQSYRPLGIWKNNQFDGKGLVNIHESVLAHLLHKQENGAKLYTDDFPYNRLLKEANFQVVGAKGVVDESKTKQLKELLEANVPDL